MFITGFEILHKALFKLHVKDAMSYLYKTLLQNETGVIPFLFSWMLIHVHALKL